MASRNRHPRSAAELADALRGRPLAAPRAALQSRSADAAAIARSAANPAANSATNVAPKFATSPTILLGIDPGTRIVGYGAIVVGRSGPKLLAAGVLRADADDSVPIRLGVLRRELDQLLERIRPTIVVVEQAFASRNVQSALRIGEGRGVVLSAAAVIGAEIVQYPPAVAKKSLVGTGAADKSQVARMVEHLLGVSLAELPLDATDALALALAHVQRASLRVL